MRDNYPYGLFSAKDKDVVEIHISSGTTGNPTLVGYTRYDVSLWSDVMARTICCAGGEPGKQSRLPTATACLPADWVFTTALSKWV